MMRPPYSANCVGPIARRDARIELAAVQLANNQPKAAIDTLRCTQWHPEEAPLGGRSPADTTGNAAILRFERAAGRPSVTDTFVEFLCGDARHFAVQTASRHKTFRLTDTVVYRTYRTGLLGNRSLNCPLSHLAASTSSGSARMIPSGVTRKTVTSLRAAPCTGHPGCW